jgi:hypothetical protein
MQFRYGPRLRILEMLVVVMILLGFKTIEWMTCLVVQLISATTTALGPEIDCQLFTRIWLQFLLS